MKDKKLRELLVGRGYLEKLPKLPNGTLWEIERKLNALFIAIAEASKRVEEATKKAHDQEVENRQILEMLLKHLGLEVRKIDAHFTLEKDTRLEFQKILDRNYKEMLKTAKTATAKGKK